MSWMATARRTQVALRRRFTDPPGGDRCSSSIALRDGSGAQCGRRARYGGRCWQHGGDCRLKAEPVLQVELLAYLLAHPKIKTEAGARRALERQRACRCRSCESRWPRDVPSCDVPGCTITKKHIHCPECGSTEHRADGCDMED